MKKFASFLVPCLLLGIIVAGCGSNAEKTPVKDSTVIITDSVPKMYIDTDNVRITDSGTGKPLHGPNQPDKKD